ncbi:MAG: hypothetical protein AAF555_05610 [Verrucomicrobiota bacterium]
MNSITTHFELIAILNDDPNRELHLHLERDCGTHSISFFISTEDAKLAEGVMNTELNEEGDYVEKLAWAVLVDCYGHFDTITEYDSLVAGTNPGTVRAMSI